MSLRQKPATICCSNGPSYHDAIFWAQPADPRPDALSLAYSATKALLCHPDEAETCKDREEKEG